MSISKKATDFVNSMIADVEHDAEVVLMHSVKIGHRQNGWIFNDKLTRGNHPFPNGQWIETSVVDQDFTNSNGERFLLTRTGTIYKVIGEGFLNV